MLTKTITYMDFNGNQRTETFHFNLTKAECIELELSTAGGIEKTIKKIVAETDIKRIAELFKGIVLKAFGIKSDDGKRFIKSDEISADFSHTEAYSELFIELISDPDATAAFINGIIPQIPNQAKSDGAVNPPITMS